MKDNIFEELKAYEAPKSLPRIADYGVQLYEAAGYKLDAAAIESLRQELAKHAGDLKDLTDNIIGLGAFALWLRDFRQDNEGTVAVAKLIGEHAPKYASIGERIGNALQDLALKATDLLDAFSGSDAAMKRRAPKYGEDSPSGTLPLKDLKPVGAPMPIKERNKKGG
ncbi:MAG: hypothetical protein KC933_16080 [Myxococcales bacterium]|nr:hypothetical protein [Myxococcales bacterium]MCB9650449.1 hypothetical protein [Deltaproteobacteria bacterium]